MAAGGGRADVTGCGTPDQVTVAAHLPSPALPRMSEDVLLRGALWIEMHRRSWGDARSVEAWPTQACPVLPRAPPSISQAAAPGPGASWPVPSAHWAFLAP